MYVNNYYIFDKKVVESRNIINREILMNLPQCVISPKIMLSLCCPYVEER